MSLDKSKRYPNLGKLSIALLEHSVKPILGEEAIKILKTRVVEHELQSELTSALQNTEERFVSEHPDKELCQIFLAMPMADLPTIQQAINKFYERPTSTDFENTLRKLLKQDFPFLSERRIEFAAQAYLRILREEISMVAPVFREKLVALATLRSEPSIKQMADSLDEILRPYSQVTLVIDRNFSEFTNSEKDNLILSLSRILNISPSQVRILHVTSGSVILTVEIPKNSIEDLVALLLKNDPAINELRIVKIEVLNKSEIAPHEILDKHVKVKPSKPEPIRILFLSSNPVDTAQLRLSEEIRSIDQALRQSEFRENFEIYQQWAVRVTDLQGALLRYKPTIVHFSGHGSSSSEIILEDNIGNSQPVSANALGHLFSVLKDDVRCVVLNACYSQTQASAIAAHIDFVIGMSKAIGDRAAISFATAFYQALGFGKSVKTAFDLGSVQINLENLGEQDTPKLLSLNTDPNTVVLAQAKSG